MPLVYQNYSRTEIEREIGVLNVVTNNEVELSLSN